MYNDYNELYHHGIKGQRWGVRHYQNEDGSYKSGAEGRYNGDEHSDKNWMRRVKMASKNRNAAIDESFKSYKADVKNAKSAYKINKKNAASREERRDAKQKYKQAKNEALDKYMERDDKIEEDYQKDRFSGITGKDIAKTTLKAVAVSAAVVAGATVAKRALAKSAATDSNARSATAKQGASLVAGMLSQYALRTGASVAAGGLIYATQKRRYEKNGRG